ncbi:MAG: T9SS type A sorting domain-containing protein [Balneolales bacterium]
MSAGTYESLYIRDDNTLWGMGRNKYGQLGDGTDSSRSTPVHIADDVLKAWAGGVHSLFLKADSSLWAMGRSNYGQLGISGSINTPVHLADGVIDADAGAFHNLFIKADGSLWGLGRNEHGELGDESLGNHFEPVHIADEVISAGAGYVQSLFVKADNTLWAMGGDGDPMAEHHASFVNQPQPKQITDSVISVRISSLHALFLRQDQSLWGMGFAAHGRLGDGTESNRPEPIYIAGNVLAAEPGTSTSLFLANEIVTLTNPDNEGEGVDPVVSLSWDSRGYDPDYHVQVAGDSLFASPVIDLANHGENELAINEGLEAYTRYFWRIRGSKDSGFGAWSQTWNFTTGEATSVDEDASVPGRFALHQNYPNPFNPATVIRYDLPEAGEVRLEVFDLLGRRVATLVNETRPSGRYDVTFDASRLSSGVYIYRLQAGPSGMQGEGSGSQAAGFTETRQMLFVK